MDKTKSDLLRLVASTPSGIQVLTEPEEFGGAYQVYVEINGTLYVLCMSVSELSKEELNVT